jgi:transposase InsO family protein
MPGETLVYEEYCRYSPWTRLAKLEGVKAADLEFGAVGKLQRPRRVNDLWEVDHHEFDVHTVLGAAPWSESCIPRILARAGYDRFWICMAIDVASGYPTGFCISFDPGSIVPALECVDHAIHIKTYVAERWPDIKGVLLGHGKPVRIRYDNAKSFVALFMGAALARVHVGFSHAKRRKPDSKPYIERFFGSVERDFIEWLAGATGSNPQAKGDRKPVKEARIPADDFVRLFHQYLIECYARRRQEGLGQRSPEEVWMAAENDPTCRPRSLTIADEKVLDLVTSIPFEGKITREGILWKGIKYQSPGLQKIRQQFGVGHRGKTTASFSGRIPVKNVGMAYVAPRQLPGQKTDVAEITVPSTNPHHQNMTYWQYRVVVADLKGRGKDPDNLADFQEAFVRLFRESLKAMGVKLPGQEKPKPRLTGGQAPRFAGVFQAGPKVHALQHLKDVAERYDVFGEIAAVAAATKASRKEPGAAQQIEERIRKWTSDPIELDDDNRSSTS